MKKPKAVKGGVVTSHSKPPPHGGHHHHQHQRHHHKPAPKQPHPAKPHHQQHHHHRTPPKKPVKRKLSPGDVACCSAEALAASLRLLGVPVGDEDVLALYWRTAAHADAGATISATLEAASVHGLAGVRLLDFREVMPSDALPEYDASGSGHHASRAGLILGADLPGSHAVLADAGTWWSWGEAHCPGCFPDAVIEEAWTVTW